MPKKARKKRRFNSWWLIIPLIIIATGAFYYFQFYAPAQVAEAAPTMKTAKVRTGDITVSANAAGVVVPAEEMQLSFGTTGRLTELLVDVGDNVEAGDVLARLDDSDQRLDMMQAEANMAAAQLKLSELKEDADPVALASAQANLYSARDTLNTVKALASDADIAAAQANLVAAQKALIDLKSGLTKAEETVLSAELEKATIAVQRAQEDYDAIAWRSDVGRTPQAAALQQATIDYEKALAAYQLATAPADAESIANADARVAGAQAALDRLLTPADSEAVAAAEAKVTQAEAELQRLLDGADPADVEVAQIGIDQALANLEATKLALSRTVLSAPMSGVITSSSASVGENLTSSPLLTVTDLDDLRVDLFVDESDMPLIEPGQVVNITLQADAETTFYGKIVEVDPTLTIVDGVPALRAQATLENPPSYVRPGMSTNLEIIAATTEGALLVPLEALRELSPGSYAVFVVEDGQPVMRVVEVGIMDFANAEIVSGLEKGEVVSTGVVETE